MNPTPVKPLFANWRAIRPQGWAWTPPPTNLVMWGPTAWTASYCMPYPRNWACLEQLVAFCRSHKQTAYPYTTPFTVSPYHMMKQDTPFITPPDRTPADALTPSKAEAERNEDYWYFAAD